MTTDHPTPDQMRLTRLLRAYLILDAFHQTPLSTGRTALTSALTTVSAACGMDTYEGIREHINSGRLPVPGTPEWPPFYARTGEALRLALDIPPKCYVCWGVLGEEEETEHAYAGGVSGPGIMGPPRHKTCPDIDELPRCSSTDCRSILFPAPRATLHTIDCDAVH